MINYTQCEQFVLGIAVGMVVGYALLGLAVVAIARWLDD